MTSYSDSLDGLGTHSTPELSLSLSMIMTFDDVSRGGVGRTGSLVVEDDAEEDDDEYQLSGFFFKVISMCGTHSYVPRRVATVDPFFPAVGGPPTATATAWIPSIDLYIWSMSMR